MSFADLPPKNRPSAPPRNAALPAFCTPRVLLITLLLGFGVALLLAIAPGVAEDRWVRLGTTAWFVAWVALITTGVLCSLQKPLCRLALPWLLLVVMAVLLAATALISVLAYQTLTRLGWNPLERQSEFMLHSQAIALVVGGMGIWIFSLHWAKTRRMTAQTKAELDALHARIRPHFLFNSLNTVAALIETDPSAAEAAVLDLSSVFRAALHAGDASTLNEELDLSQRYLALEHWRLGARLVVDWVLPSTPLPPITVPILTLQPLIENAVRYAVERSTAPCTIRIECLVGVQAVSVLIENPLINEPKAAVPEGNGISLQNIRDRLALMFGDRASLRAGIIEDKFRVKLVLPLDGGGAP
ncbi:MAG: histidine kinase [Halothiobacillaceae bacterium]|nr:histidine kinase [Halothiobacillaceae bacterium]